MTRFPYDKTIYESFNARLRAGRRQVLWSAFKRAVLYGLIWGVVVGAIFLLGSIDRESRIPLQRRIVTIIGFGIIGGTLTFLTECLPCELYLIESGILVRQTMYRRHRQFLKPDTEVILANITVDLVQVTLQDRFVASNRVVVWLQRHDVDRLNAHLQAS